MNFAFISRHSMTQEQITIAEELGINLIHVGDMDAFTITPEMVKEHGNFDGVVIVHPASAMRLKDAYKIGIFENGQRSIEGERPTFFAKSLHIF